MIRFIQIDKYQISLLYQMYESSSFASCYHSSNVVSISLSQSDHIKQPPLFIFLSTFCRDAVLKIIQLPDVIIVFV